MEIMTEEELRAINPEEFEGKDFSLYSGPSQAITLTGIVLFDYDQGLSITNKEKRSHCIVAIHGPSYSQDSNYTSKESYHKELTVSFMMLKGNIWNGDLWDEIVGKTPFNNRNGGSTCPFT